MRGSKRSPVSARVAGAIGALVMTSAVAQPLDPALDISVTTSLFDTDPDLGTAVWDASLNSTIGGVSTDGAVLNETLININDGVGHTASLSGDNLSLSQLGGDYTLSIANLSSDPYRVLIRVMLDHSVDSDDGGEQLDARTVSELDFADGNDTEYLFSRLISESGMDYFTAGNARWQDQTFNENSSALLTTWGDAVSLTSTGILFVTVGPGETTTLNGSFDLDGRAFELGAGFSATSSLDLIVRNAVNLTTIDSDGDGLVDAIDNCPLVPNADQTPGLTDPSRGIACELLPPGC